jgi:hypothetical protein
MRGARQPSLIKHFFVQVTTFQVRSCAAPATYQS